MDYVIEIDVWNLGFDEADELIDAICDTLVERGLGTDPEKTDSDVRSIVALKPYGVTRLDASSPTKARRVLKRFASGARLVAIPGTEYRKTRA